MGEWYCRWGHIYTWWMVIATMGDWKKWSSSQNHVFGKQSRKRCRALLTVQYYSQVLMVDFASFPWIHDFRGRHECVDLAYIYMFFLIEVSIYAHAHKPALTRGIWWSTCLPAFLGSEHCGDGAASCWCWARCSHQPLGIADVNLE